MPTTEGSRAAAGDRPRGPARRRLAESATDPAPGRAERRYPDTDSPEPRRSAALAEALQPDPCAAGLLDRAARPHSPTLGGDHPPPAAYPTGRNRTRCARNVSGLRPDWKDLHE